MNEPTAGDPGSEPFDPGPEPFQVEAARLAGELPTKPPDPSEGAEARSASETKEWWDDPNMPWRHKPTRSDLACMGWIGFMGLFGLVMLPLRGWLLGLNPPLLLALTGSRSGSAALGALASVGDYLAWWWPMLAGSLMSIKFDWVFWWSGKLWGRGMIEVWAGRSDRAARNFARAERVAQKFGIFGMFVAYVPIPLPLMQVIFVLAGASGWSWKKFMALDFLASTVWLIAYFLLGWAVGEPAVQLLKGYAKIANYVAIGLVVLVIGTTIWNGRKKKS